MTPVTVGAGSVNAAMKFELQRIRGRMTPVTATQRPGGLDGGAGRRPDRFNGSGAG